MQAGMVFQSGRRSVPPKLRKTVTAYGGSRFSAADVPVYFYVAFCKGFAKIGLTENTKTRVSSLQCGNPFPIELIFAVPLPREMAAKAEHEALLALNDVHWLGDWFKCTRSHAKYVVSSVIAKVQRGDFNEPPTEEYPEFVKFPGLKRRVFSPDGLVFDSIAKAADHLGVSRQTMHGRLGRNWKGWRFG